MKMYFHVIKIKKIKHITHKLLLHEFYISMCVYVTVTSDATITVMKG